MKKIIAVLLVVAIFATFTACGNKTNADFSEASETHSIKPEVTESETVPTENKAIGTYDAFEDIVIKELDKNVKENLGDSLLATEYENGTYYIFAVIDNVNDRLLIVSTETDVAVNNLTKTIHENFNIDCILTIVDDETHSNALHVSLNGYDVTDQLS